MFYIFDLDRVVGFEAVILISLCEVWPRRPGAIRGPRLGICVPILCTPLPLSSWGDIVENVARLVRLM